MLLKFSNHEVRYGHRLRDHGKYTALRQKNMKEAKVGIMTWAKAVR